MSRPFNTSMMDQLRQAGAPTPCFKQGFISEEAAAAQLRSIIKLDDRKKQIDLDKMRVYKCKRCAFLKLPPFHTGHKKEKTNGTVS